MTEPVSPRLLYHFARPADWMNDPQKPYLTPTFIEEQFIHLCDRSQATDVFQRFFKGQDVIVLAIGHAAIQSQVRWEDLYGHGLYPHLYAPLPRTAIIEQLELTGTDPQAEQRVEQFVSSTNP